MCRGMPSRILTVMIMVLGLTACLSQSAKSASRDAQVPPYKPANNPEIDAIFNTWDKKASPGMSLAVIKEGKIVYSRGYGLASLEFDVPNTPKTIFHIASVSKQFTAFAIQLLAHDGKLSLDDDVRKYLPELHDFGTTITINHLLHHTSGLRDQWSLVSMAGWRMADVITEDDILSLIWRQNELNFKPGDEYVYSNTGYTLLAEIVHRVSGMTFADFTAERIFKPLKMDHTHFQTDYDIVVPGRAYSYGRHADGFRYIALSYSNVGATSLFTTVQDLARWDQNFYDAKIGGPAVVSAMQVKGRLNSGKEIEYASGLRISSYRGLKTIEHTGGDAGYRTVLLRFPEKRFSVVILSNLGDVDPLALATRVADIYLKQDFREPLLGASAAPPNAMTTIDPALLDAYVGTYRIFPGYVVTFTKTSDHLTVDHLTPDGAGRDEHEIFPSSSTRFFAQSGEEDFEFSPPKHGGPAMKVSVHIGPGNGVGERLTLESLTEAAAHRYLGEFHSNELDVHYQFQLRDGRLVVHHPRGDIVLMHTADNVFEGVFPLIGTITFHCGPNSLCDTFMVDDGANRNVRFIRDGT